MKNKKSIKNNQIQFDKSLNQFENKVLFPEKLLKANEMLKTIGLPLGIMQNNKV